MIQNLWERDVDKVAAMDMADTEYAIDKEQKEKREQDILNAEYDIKPQDIEAPDQAEESGKRPVGSFAGDYGISAEAMGMSEKEAQDAADAIAEMPKE